MRSLAQVFNVLIPTGVAFWLGYMSSGSYWDPSLAAVFMAAIFGIGERTSNEAQDILRRLDDLKSR